ncbi:hypothetical protein PghCCS26_46640 [Paenibacillus glycanilyticus]|uniref:Uncharacterized protein n=1 Tax=Paenibacillus glycanilyticus TaxID=126569 RepID=A0ABQ6NU73_9BACL|nr:hypothetical protein PghCCS26_46640 [Paenibacillus glycanilyticus]
MRNPERISNITRLIQELWMDKYTDLRYFQLISFLSQEYTKRNNNNNIKYPLTKQEQTSSYKQKIDLFDLEDDVLEGFLITLLNEK